MFSFLVKKSDQVQLSVTLRRHCVSPNTWMGFFPPKRKFFGNVWRFSRRNKRKYEKFLKYKYVYVCIYLARWIVVHKPQFYWHIVVWWCCFKLYSSQKIGKKLQYKSTVLEFLFIFLETLLLHSKYTFKKIMLIFLTSSPNCTFFRIFREYC